MRNVIDKWDSFIRKKQNMILLGVALLFLACLPFFIVKSKNSHEDLKFLSQFYESVNYEKINFVLKRNETLRPTFEGILVQRLLDNGEVSLAKKVAKRAFERTKKEAPLFTKYAEITLLIAGKGFGEALKNSYELKESLISFKNSPLFGYNLIRIAFLHKVLGETEKEKATWAEMRSFVKENQSFNYFIEKAKLADYIGQN